MGRTSAFFGVLAATGIGAMLVIAGPIDPPPGPVSSTFKTLAEVEPRIAVSAANTPGDADSQFKISKPGSYYLTGNVEGVSGKSCVKITSSDVTLDLMGHTLRGVSGSVDGIRVAESAASQVSIRNGVVAGFDGDGISLIFGKGKGDLVEGIRAAENGGTGIRASDGAIVRGCVARGNGVTGIAAGTAAVIESCVAFVNGLDGISAAGGAGISACSSNSNGRIGFNAGFGTVFTGCTAMSNGSSGYLLLGASTVEGCTADFNGGDGILAISGCTVRGNTCTENGTSGDGAGIRITGLENRIEENNCTGADRGIFVEASGNLIARNICAANTVEWDIAAGNAVAPIVQASINNTKIQGSTFGGSLGSTDPNANFTY